MKQITGTIDKILDIDLTARSFSVYHSTDADRTMYLGGKGLGLKLLYDRLVPGCDPLGDENILVIMPGVIMGTGAPCSGRFSAVTKSPLTGIMVSSSCGGPFGMALKTSGWDGCILRGASTKPVHLVISSGGVEFRSGMKLWGKTTTETESIITGDGKGSLVIGPAGENLVRYANAVSGKRFLGRGGIGAVLGSKKIKAITARGGETAVLPVLDKKFQETKRKANTYINRNDFTAKAYRKYGTNANMKLNHDAGLMTVNNFTSGSDPRAVSLYGETLAEQNITGHHTCKPCTILCGHKGNFDGKETPVPEYETMGLLGSNIGIFNPCDVANFNDICTEMGMDTISAGGTLSWAMEAGEKGLYKTKLKFGDSREITRALKDIAALKGQGRELAMGSRWLSKKYGGEDFAIQVKGMEMAAYDPRGSWGQALSYAVANRGACHLATASFAIERYFNMIEPFTARSKASMVAFLENTFSAVNSLHTCQFTAFPYELEPALVKYTPKFLLKFFMTNAAALAMRLMDISLWPELWSSVTGRPLGITSFLKAGARIQILERHMNCREGIRYRDDTLPLRMLYEKRPGDRDQLIPLETMVSRYYAVRGIAPDGTVKKTTLKKFGISAGR